MDWTSRTDPNDLPTSELGDDSTYKRGFKSGGEFVEETTHRVEGSAVVIYLYTNNSQTWIDSLAQMFLDHSIVVIDKDHSEYNELTSLPW
jgi:hypothetical protein